MSAYPSPSSKEEKADKKTKSARNKRHDTHLATAGTSEKSSLPPAAVTLKRRLVASEAGKSPAPFLRGCVLGVAHLLAETRSEDIGNRNDMQRGCAID